MTGRATLFFIAKPVRTLAVAIYMVVPAQDCHVASLLAMTKWVVPARGLGMPPPYRRVSLDGCRDGACPILLNQRLCLRRQSLLANRLDSATPFCSLHPPQAALANVPVREAADSADEQICTNLVVPAPARRVVAPYGEGAFHIRRARRPRRGHVPALQGR